MASLSRDPHVRGVVAVHRDEQCGRAVADAASLRHLEELRVIVVMVIIAHPHHRRRRRRSVADRRPAGFVVVMPGQHEDTHITHSRRAAAAASQHKE